MTQYRVFTHRLTTPDGKVIAEAKSAAFAAGNGHSTVRQTVTVKIDTSGNRCSSSSTSESVAG